MCVWLRVLHYCAKQKKEIQQPKHILLRHKNICSMKYCDVLDADLFCCSFCTRNLSVSTFVFLSYLQLCFEKLSLNFLFFFSSSDLFQEKSSQVLIMVRDGKDQSSLRRIPSVWTSSWSRPSSTVAPKGPPPVAGQRTTTTTRNGERSERAVCSRQACCIWYEGSLQFDDCFWYTHVSYQERSVRFIFFQFETWWTIMKDALHPHLFFPPFIVYSTRIRTFWAFVLKRGEVLAIGAKLLAVYVRSFCTVHQMIWTVWPKMCRF